MKKTAMLLTACLLAASCMVVHAEEPFHRDGGSYRNDGR